MTGYVKNLADGQVELMAEGEPVEVERFLTEVARQMAGYIQDTTAREETPHGFANFEIRA